MGRLILMLGFWPPTDCGVPGRPGMLEPWKNRTTIQKGGKSYDILALSPEFSDPLGTTLRDPEEPFWGKGKANADAFIVDYRDTVDKFWKIVSHHRPVAILSFSRWKYTHEWCLDEWATNWQQHIWTLDIPYHPPGSREPVSMKWVPPEVTTGEGPDGERLAALEVKEGELPPLASRRFSNLPMGEIVTALSKAFTADRLKPMVNSQIGPGRFVSNFLAYHVAWYREQWTLQNTNPDLACLFSGHTHVGGRVSVADATSAVRIQLEEVLKRL